MIETMAAETPATRALKALGVSFELHVYDYDPNAESVGLQAADALGEPPQRVLKTLIIRVDGRPACVVLPSDREVGMKKAAIAFGGKSAAMMPVADTERLTGYKVGGVSPFGQKRALPTLVAMSATAEPYVYVNGGQRGLQVRLSPNDLLRAAAARSADIVMQ
jgi:Cys-tRNA(Pro)/Cys-tRNA(Cys) deacylase